MIKANEAKTKEEFEKEFRKASIIANLCYRLARLLNPKKTYELVQLQFWMKKDLGNISIEDIKVFRNATYLGFIKEVDIKQQKKWYEFWKK